MLFLAVVALLASPAAAQDHDKQLQQLENQFHATPQQISPLPVQIKPSEKEIKRWVEELGDESIEIRERALNKLLDHRVHIKTRIKEFLQDTSDAEVIWRLNEVLKDPRIEALRSKLSEETRDTYPDLHRWIYSGDKEKVNAVLDIIFPYQCGDIIENNDFLKEAACDNLAEKFNNWSWIEGVEIRERLTAYLREKHDPKFIPGLKSLLKDSDDQVRSAALTTLSEIQSHEGAIKSAEMVLNNPDRIGLDAAIDTLTKLKSKKHADQIEALFSEDSRGTEFACLKYFTELFPKEERSVKIMLRLLETPGRGPISETLDTIDDWGLAGKYREEIEAVPSRIMSLETMDSATQNNILNKVQNILDGLDKK